MGQPAFDGEEAAVAYASAEANDNPDPLQSMQDEPQQEQTTMLDLPAEPNTTKGESTFKRWCRAVFCRNRGPQRQRCSEEDCQ